MFRRDYAAKDVRCPLCYHINRISLADGGNFNRPPKTSKENICSKIKRKVRGSSSSSQPRPHHPSPLKTNSSRDHPRKRALLCGITYKNCKYKLKGTVNDVRNMERFLINQFKFPREEILVLTEDGDDPDSAPTKKNIENGLSWLVDDCQDGDSLVFFYSGHGLRQPDFENDELDGFDETICPVDFEKEGMIIDNYINTTIVRPLKPGVRLHAIIDACHSGTVLDLEYFYSREKRKWEDNKAPSGAEKGTSGGLAICISACEDDQVASDTTAFTSNLGAMNGAMTYLLIEIVNSCQNITYGNLLDRIYKRIEEVNQQGCLNKSRILRKLCKSTITQKPLLSASEPFDVNREQFNL